MQPGRQQRQGEHHRPEHQHAHQLDQGADLYGNCCDRRGGGQHLRHGVDGQPREHAVLMPRQAQQRREQRQPEHGHHAEHGGEGNGGRHVVAVCPDHGRHGRDRRVAADGVAAGHQQRHTHGQAEQAPDAVAGDDGDGDDAGDAEQHPRSDREHGGSADAGAEQDHGHLEQGLGRELDARPPARPGWPSGANSGADQDRQHQRLQPGTAEEGGLGVLQGQGGEGDRDAECHARQNPYWKRRVGRRDNSRPGLWYRRDLHGHDPCVARKMAEWIDRLQRSIAFKPIAPADGWARHQQIQRLRRARQCPSASAIRRCSRSTGNRFRAQARSCGLSPLSA